VARAGPQAVGEDVEEPRASPRGDPQLRVGPVRQALGVAALEPVAQPGDEARVEVVALARVSPVADAGRLAQATQREDVHGGVLAGQHQGRQHERVGLDRHVAVRGDAHGAAAAQGLHALHQGHEIAHR